MLRSLTMNLIDTVAILGTGLLGASLARALKARGVAKNVKAWSRSESTREKCRALPNIFDEVCESPSCAAANADLIVLCTPTDKIPVVAAEISGNLKGGAILTDVGSVKTAICSQCEKICVGTGAVFVGSHPMAGSEKIGIDFSDDRLFENRPCFVVSNSQDEPAAKILADFWTAVGMKVYCTSPRNHDFIVAHISHLPHLLAGTLCVNASKSPDDLKKYCGPGFRDTTRVASGSPEIWESIISDNRSEILPALKDYRADLDALISNIENCDSAAVAAHLRAAKKYRDELQNTL